MKSPVRFALVACTATDAHDVAHRVPRRIWNEWGMILLKEEP
jgi:hypothetical protein